MRKELWGQIDVNGNGFLSLAEISKVLMHFHYYFFGRTFNIFTKKMNLKTYSLYELISRFFPWKLNEKSQK